MPADLGQEDDGQPAQITHKQREEWARNVVQKSVTHVRRVVSGVEEWAPIRVLENGATIEGPFDLTIGQLDRGGTGIVPALALALVRDYNDGGPFGGLMRRFQLRRSSRVLRDGKVEQLQSARDGAEPAGHTGEADTPE